MGLLDPNTNAPGADVTLISAASSNTSSSLQTVGGFSTFRFEVTGTWTGIIRMWAVYGTTTVQIPVFGALGASFQNITANGIYTASIAGYDSVRIRAEPATGSVTVIGELCMGIVNTPRRRVVPISWVLAYPVAAGATVKPIATLDVSYYTQIMVAARGAGGTGQFQVLYQPQPLAGTSTYGSSESTLTILDTTLRGYTPPFTPHDVNADFSIVNSSGADITVDLRVLGLT